jgi:uncharacterized protein YjdB
MRISRRRVWLIGLILAAGCSRKAATISVTPPKAKIFGIGRTLRLTGRLLDKKGQPLTDGFPTWKSTDASIVEVDSGGRLTAKAEGKTTVKAVFNKIETAVPVEVVDVKSLDVVPASANLIGPAGTQFPLEFAIKDSKDRPLALKPVWSSTDAKIATVSDSGVVVSVAPGTTTVVAKVGDMQSASEIRVSIQPIAKIEIHPETALVRVGDSQKFDIVAYGIDGRPIEGASAVFSSSNPSVAKLDPTGRVSGLANGTATIQAAVAGTTAQATLIVN